MILSLFFFFSNSVVLRYGPRARVTVIFVNYSLTTAFT